MGQVSITVVYDNIGYEKDLKTDWGFSALVRKNGKGVLFDTGSNGEILLYNMEKLGISAQEIGKVVLSHQHWDHVGGLQELLKRNPGIEAYLPESFGDDIKKMIESLGSKYTEVSGAEDIAQGVRSTGELGMPIKEQGMLVETGRGHALLTGCAHPGIENVVEKAGELTDKGIYLLMGGFHLKEASKKKISSIIEVFRTTGVGNVAPSHCTGESAMHMLRDEYKEHYIESGAGKRIEI